MKRINILFLILISYCCMPMEIINKKIEMMIITYEPSTQLRSTPLKIEVKEDGYIDIIKDSINNESKLVFQGPKLVSIEGSYSLEVYYIDNTTEKFSIRNNLTLFRNNSASFYENKVILSVMRDFLFMKLIELGIKLE